MGADIGGAVTRASGAGRASVPGPSTLAVVIPAYNEVRSIRGVAEGALAACPRVIVVDDGSTDGTAAALADLPVELLIQPSNMGKAAALRRGFDAALARGADAVVTLDGDGQHRPADIERLVRAARREPTRLIVGSRLKDSARFPTGRLIANRIANFWISWAAGHRIADSQSGFRCYPAGLLRRMHVAETDRGFVFESAVLIEAARLGHATRAVDIPALYDAETFRPSHFRPAHDITAIVRMVAWSLIRRGLHPRGLIRSLRRPAGEARSDGPSAPPLPAEE